MTQKTIALTLLVIAEIFGMSLWFSSSAVLTDMIAEHPVSALRQALLSSGVQLGFAIGALCYAIGSFADRYDPRHVFAWSAFGASLANAALLVAPIGGVIAICARILTGALLAGVYPVGMKIGVGWGTKDRGFLVGLLVGALTLGSAAPHLLSFMGGAQWRYAVAGTSVLGMIGGIIILFAKLGPHHAQAAKFQWGNFSLAWKDRNIRLSILGYLGHMWELYAFWAWISVALIISFGLHMPIENARALAKLIAFCAVGIGAISCVIAGLYADIIGKAKTTIIAMAGSASAALLAALFFESAPYLMIIIALIWGAFVIADSAQFSALIADYTPPEQTGTILTLQTALGFAVTIISVQGAPFLADMVGWRAVFIVLAAGPIFGIWAMKKLVPITK